MLDDPILNVEDMFLLHNLSVASRFFEMNAHAWSVDHGNSIGITFEHHCLLHSCLRHSVLESLLIIVHTLCNTVRQLKLNYSNSDGYASPDWSDYRTGRGDLLGLFVYFRVFARWLHHVVIFPSGRVLLHWRVVQKIRVSLRDGQADLASARLSQSLKRWWHRRFDKTDH